MKAFCWANGVIEFGRSVPEGAILVASGPAKPLRDLIIPTARLAYDGKTLLVPGVPEAQSETAKVDALIGWQQWIAERHDPCVVVNVGRRQ